MSEQERDLDDWVSDRRSVSGLGVGCSEAQADGMPCDCVAGDCECCRRSAEGFERDAARPQPDPLLDPSYG